MRTKGREHGIIIANIINKPQPVRLATPGIRPYNPGIIVNNHSINDVKNQIITNTLTLPVRIIIPYEDARLPLAECVSLVTGETT